MHTCTHAHTHTHTHTHTQDDPYWFLHFGDAKAVADVKDFKRPPLSSYMSMDTEKRVIRFDSMSKVLSSGIRIGFATGPNGLMDQLSLHNQATNLHTSGVSQMLVFKLFDMWGEAGWLEHTNKVALFYQQRRDAFMHYAAKHLTGKATWVHAHTHTHTHTHTHIYTHTHAHTHTHTHTHIQVNPSSGLFVWFDLSPSGITDSQVQTFFLTHVMVFSQDI
jgi:aspartate/methionine/tyrosine aminotransferase